MTVSRGLAFACREQAKREIFSNPGKFLRPADGFFFFSLMLSSQFITNISLPTPSQGWSPSSGLGNVIRKYELLGQDVHERYLERLGLLVGVVFSCVYVCVCKPMVGASGCARTSHETVYWVVGTGVVH